MAITLDGTNGITTPDLDSTGPITGTTGTFSGAVQASGVTTNIYPIVSGTAVASTSGTSIDFTGIPSWVKRITVMFSGVSTNGTSEVLLQIGDSGGVETSGYLGAVAQASHSSTSNVYSFTTGVRIDGAANAAAIRQGSIIITLIDASTNLWAFMGCIGRSDNTVSSSLGGTKALSATLDRVRITTISGTNTFDAGSINILYE